MEATIYVGEVVVIDPETGGEVEVELHKDPTSGAIFGIEPGFIETLKISSIRSPYNVDVFIELSRED